MIIWKWLRGIINKLLFCLLIILLLIKIIDIFLAIDIVDQDSMFPTIRNGDKVLVLSSVRLSKKNGHVIRPFKIKRGYIYIINNKANGVLNIKRCIGLSGDSIIYNNNSVIVIKNNITTSYISALNSTGSMKNTSYMKCDDGFFFIGDNISSSVDSRSYGTITKNEIIGKYILTLKLKKK